MIEVKTIDCGVTYPLRHQVLRAGRPIEECYLEGDEDQTTFHLGAFRGQDLLGVVSVMAEVENPSTSGAPTIPEYRLRAMAVCPTGQQRGTGRLLVEACFLRLREESPCRLWCKARTAATGFYQKMGFAICSEEFVDPQFGPHFMMELRVLPGGNENI